MKKSMADIRGEIARYSTYLVEHSHLERVFGSLDAVRRKIENLQIILSEMETENGHQ